MTKPSLLLAQTSQYDWTIPETTTAQLALSIFVLVALIAIVVVVRSRAAVRGLPEEQKAHRSAVREDRHESSPRVWQSHRTTVESLSDAEVRERVSALVDVETDASPTRQSSLHRALREIYGALRLAWRERTQRIPGIVLASLRWAVLVAVFGAVAVSTGGVVAVLESLSQDSGQSLTAYLGDLVALGQSALTASISLAGEFPYTGALFQFAWAFLILGAEWLYRHWWLLAALAALNAVAFGVLHLRGRETRPVRLLRSHLRVAAGLSGWLLAVWTTGTAVSALAAMATSTLANAIGFAAAFVVGGWLAYRGLRRLTRGVRDQLHRFEGIESREAAATSLLYWFARLLNAVTAGFVVIYAAVAVADGRVGRVGAAIAAASLDVQAALFFATATILVVAAYLVRESWPDVRAALHAAVAQKTVRVQLVTRGAPLLVVMVGYALLYAITRSIPFAIGGAVLLAILAVNVIRAVMAASYKRDWLALAKEAISPSASMYVFAAGQTLHDADGRERYYLRINGDTYLSDDPEELIADGVAAVRDAATPDHELDDAAVPDGKPFSWWYADFLLNYGISDRSDAEAKLRERVRKSALHPLRSRGPSIERERFDRALAKYPESVRRQRLAELEAAGVIYRDDQHVTLETDPFATHTHR